MKTKIKKISKLLFLLFLIFYAFTMLEHTLKIDFNFISIIVFLLGLSLAIFAHARKNYFTVILLLIHMSIEWFEWSQKSFSMNETLLNLGHVVMDFVFLYHELSAHFGKYKKTLLFVISIFLISIFSISYFFLSDVSSLDIVVETIEPFVIGGILGCVGSHLIYHIKRFGKKKEEGGECCEH